MLRYWSSADRAIINQYRFKIMFALVTYCYFVILYFATWHKASVKIKIRSLTGGSIRSGFHATARFPAVTSYSVYPQTVYFPPVYTKTILKQVKLCDISPLNNLIHHFHTTCRYLGQFIKSSVLSIVITAINSVVSFI